jgi:hypothetical protein
MKNRLNQNRNFLFVWACQGTKYFALTLLAFVFTYFISEAFRVSRILQTLMSLSLWEWLARIAISIFCFFLLGIVYESLR